MSVGHMSGLSHVRWVTCPWVICSVGHMSVGHMFGGSHVRWVSCPKVNKKHVVLVAFEMSLLIWSFLGK